MEHGPFMDDVPTKTSIYKGFSMAMLNHQRVFHDIQILNMVVFRTIQKESPIYGASGIVGCFNGVLYVHRDDQQNKRVKHGWSSNPKTSGTLWL